MTDTREHFIDREFTTPAGHRAFWLTVRMPMADTGKADKIGRAVARRHYAPTGRLSVLSGGGTYNHPEQGTYEHRVCYVVGSPKEG